MDPISLIVGALVTGILAGLEGVAAEAVQDGYRALRDTLIRRYGSRAKAGIEQLEKNPTSEPVRRAVEQEFASLGMAADPEIKRLSEQLTYLIEHLEAQEQPATPVLNILEEAQKQAGMRAMGKVLDAHVDQVMQVRATHEVDDEDLLTANIHRAGTVPQAVRDQLADLHRQMRAIIEQIARHIEDGKYRDAEHAIVNLPLAASERRRAERLIQADKQMHISYQALKVTVEYFGDLNQLMIRRIEQESSRQKEANMVLGNAIMVYELTDFVIEYIQDFNVNGRSEFEQLHQEAKKKIAEQRAANQNLEHLANRPDIEMTVRERALEDMRHNKATIDTLEREWEIYAHEVKQYYAAVGDVRGSLPTLELIRESARVQISIIQLIAMLRFLRQNFGAIQGTVEALHGFRLAPLSPGRVRRLLGIGSGG